MINKPNMPCVFAVMVVIAAAVQLSSATARADDDLKERIGDEHAEGADHWIYNDISKGIAEARATGKPLFVTFRCVPCSDCLGFDGEVASGNEQVRKLAADKFICVRQIEMKGVNLSMFQFDYDLNWAAMFLNPDGTVYARYGTQSEKGADAYNSVEGLLNTMHRVLQIHSQYPKNRSLLRDKRGPEKPWATAEQMPTLEPSLRKGGQTTRSNCIHCHNIHDAENAWWQKQGTLSHDRLWRYPLPENIGLTLSAADGRTVTAVAAGSPAADAGIQPGWKVDTANGQLISSIADVQWVLHHIPNKDHQTISLTFESGRMVQLKLAEGWKQTDISWRGSLWALSPRLRVWMPPLNSIDRENAGLDEKQPALLVKWINRRQPGGRAAFDAGLREGDILVSAAGRPIARTPEKFSAWVKLNYKVGERVPVEVLRKNRRMRIMWPLVE